MNLTRSKIVFILCFFALIMTPVCRAAGITLHTKITGVDDAIQQNIQNRLAVIQDSYGNNLTAEKAARFFKAAPHNIQQAIQPFGYFKASVQPKLTRQGSDWTANFNIRLGPPVYVTKLDVQISGPGEQNPALQKYLRQFPIATGQIFDAKKYETAKEMLFQVANNQGYLKAILDKKIISIDLKNNTAAIILHLNTGPCYYFGEITFHQDSFSESFLRRFFAFRENDPFSSQKLLKLQEDLSSSRYFKQIDITPQMNNIQNFRVPTKIALTANKAQEYNIGGGYGTFTGPRLTLGTNLRHLTKTGHHLNVQMKLSPVLSGLAAQYVIPGQHPLTDQYTLGANIQKFKPKNGESNSKTVSIGYTKSIHDWKSTLTLGYLRESYFITDDQSSHNSRLMFPSLRISHIKADNLINPRLGHKIDIILQGATTKMVSNVSFVQSEIKGTYIVSPTEPSRVILRGDFGYTVVSDLTMLPLSLQFFAGGINSVRGFRYTQFGPGRYLKVASLEYQHRIIGQWYGAVFYDAGVASDNFNASLGKGIGVGIIYDSVIGPIKLYAGNGNWQHTHSHSIEFSIGPDL